MWVYQKKQTSTCINELFDGRGLCAKLKWNEKQFSSTTTTKKNSQNTLRQQIHVIDTFHITAPSRHTENAQHLQLISAFFILNWIRSNVQCICLIFHLLLCYFGSCLEFSSLHLHCSHQLFDRVTTTKHSYCTRTYIKRLICQCQHVRNVKYKKL